MGSVDGKSVAAQTLGEGRAVKVLCEQLRQLTEGKVDVTESAFRRLFKEGEKRIQLIAWTDTARGR
ncbi:hypothetical protein DSECCO2_659690 [anaerobic digester metagenome]